MQDFRKLRVWKDAHSLTLDLYKATRSFPKEELYGLTSQIRKAAASVPANIAEGCGRASNRDFARFLRIARGSANEVDYLLELSKDLEYLDPAIFAKFSKRIEDIKRMLYGLISKVVGNSVRG